MNQRWEERSPTLRRPIRPDDADEIDVRYSTRVPARARYIPLAQRDPVSSSPQSVFVVDQRRQGGRNRQPFPGSAPSPRFARPLSPSQQQPSYVHPRLAAPRMRQTQDDPQYHQRPYQHRPLQDEQDAPTLGADEEEAPTPRRRRLRVHWTLSVGLGMLVMLLLWYVGLSLLSWWRVTQDDLHYGRPRTFQCDAVVGHHDSAAHPSHFLALNSHRQVEIIELPGGDPTKARIYLGPLLVGPGADLIPVALTFCDVNGDGKPDMLVDIQGSLVVFLNDGGQFRPLKPGEHVQV